MAEMFMFPKSCVLEEEAGVRTESNSFLLEVNLRNSSAIKKSVNFTIGKKLRVETKWTLDIKVECRHNYSRPGDNKAHKSSRWHGSCFTNIKKFSISPYQEEDEEDNQERHASIAHSVKHRMHLNMYVQEKTFGQSLSKFGEQEGLELDKKDFIATPTFYLSGYGTFEQILLNYSPVLVVKLEVSSTLDQNTGCGNLFCQRISEDLAEALESGDHHDVIVKVSGSGSKEGPGRKRPCTSSLIPSDSDSSAALDIPTARMVEFKAHKVILAAKSLKWRKYFATGNKTETYIPGISPEAMEIFLHFLYTGKLAAGWEDVVDELIHTGKKLEVASIFPLLDKCLIEACNEDTFAKLLYLAHTHQLTTAEKNICRFITKLKSN